MAGHGAKPVALMATQTRATGAPLGEGRRLVGHRPQADNQWTAKTCSEATVRNSSARLRQSLPHFRQATAKRLKEPSAMAKSTVSARLRGNQSMCGTGTDVGARCYFS